MDTFLQSFFDSAFLAVLLPWLKAVFIGPGFGCHYSIITAAVAGGLGVVGAGVSAAGSYAASKNAADSAGMGALVGTSPTSTLLAKHVLGMNQDRYGRWIPNKFYNQGKSAINKNNIQQIADMMQQRLFTPPEATELESAAPGVAKMALENLPGAMQAFKSSIAGAEEAARTGFLTDIDPIRQQAIRNFQRNTLPQLREGNASQRFSSDAIAAETNAAADMHSELGALGAQFQESANQRRLAALGIAPSIAASATTLPLNIASDLISSGAQLRALNEQSSPGGHLLNMLGQIQGVYGDQSYLQRGYNPAGSSTANTLGALGESIQGLGSAASQVDWGAAWNGIKGMFGGNKTQTISDNSQGNYFQPIA